MNGELQIQEGEKKVDTGSAIDKLHLTPTSDDIEWQDGFFTWSDGSSGFMGSSGIFASSSNHMRK